MSGPSSISQDARFGPNKPNVSTRRGRAKTSAKRPDDPQPPPPDSLQPVAVPLQSTAGAEAAADPGRLREELQRSKEEMEEKASQYRARCEMIKRDYEQLNYEDQQLRLFRERVRTTREQLENGGGGRNRAVKGVRESSETKELN